MTNSKSTKRALVSSALAVFLCVAMLIGTTFAWFTDTATTGVNKIQAGTLKVDIIGATDNDSITGTGLKFVNANNSSEILWEPGATFKTEGFRIANKGNLALKYTLVLNGVTGDAKLLEVIDFTVVKVDGTAVELDEFVGQLTADVVSDVFYIQGYMKKEAGNAYQGKELEGLSITVIATQDTVEVDSNDDQYDNESAWSVSTANEFKAALLNCVKKGGNIELANDIDMAGYEWPSIVTNKSVNITINGNNHSIKNLCIENYNTEFIPGTKHYQFGLFSSISKGSVTIENLVCDRWTSGTENYWKTGNVGLIAGNVNGTLNLDNVTVKNSTVYGYQKVAALVGTSNAATISVKNIKTENVNVYACFEVAKLIGNVARSNGAVNIRFDATTIDTSGITCNFWQNAINADLSDGETYEFVTVDSQNGSYIKFNFVDNYLYPGMTNEYTWYSHGESWTQDNINGTSWAVSNNIIAEKK